MTGGAGFIGSHVVDALVGRGLRVIVVDNLATGKQRNVHSKAVFHRVDLTDERRVKEVLERERPSVVFHLAAQASVSRSMREPVVDISANLIGAANLFEACRTSGVRRIIYSSTGGALYGEPEKLPCDEDHPIRPLSVYGVSKYAVEHYLRVFSLDAGIPYVVLRYANVYGPRQDPEGEAGVVAIFSKRMLRGTDVTVFGDGEQTRDFVYVSDVVDANLKAYDTPEANGGVFNIGTGHGATVNEVFRELARATGYARAPVYAPARSGEVYRIHLDVGRAKRALGWAPRVQLADGLRRTVESIRAAGE